MDGVFFDVDVSINTKKARHQLVMVTGDINYASSFPGLAQDFLDDVVVLLRPINSTAQRPDIDQIADDVERVEVIFAKEIEQRCSIAAARS